MMTNASSHTILIIQDGTFLETHEGFAWKDAIDVIWNGDIVWNGDVKKPLSIIYFDRANGTAPDITDEVVTELAERTFDERETPSYLCRLLNFHNLDYFTEREHIRDVWDEHRLSGLQLGVGRYV